MHNLQALVIIAIYSRESGYTSVIYTGYAKLALSN